MTDEPDAPLPTQREAAPPKPLEMIPVDSSNLHAIGHDAGSNKLHVHFKTAQGDPTQYVYDDVPADVFDAFLKSDSKGAFFHSQIRGKFNHTRKDTP